MTTRRFRGVTRRTVSGAFIDERLELAEDPPRSPAWFGCGVYTIDDRRILVVDEPTDLLQCAAAAKLTVPTWTTAVVGATVLSAESEPPRIQLEVLYPDNLDEDSAAFAAVCASYDDAFHDANPVDGLVRVGDRVLHVRAERDTRSAEWSGAVEDAGESARRELAQWRLYRKVSSRWGWGGWGRDGFRFSETSPYDVANLVPFSLLPLDGLQIAVFQEPLTLQQRGGLAGATLPPWIDVVAGSHLITPSDASVARIEVYLVHPSTTDPTAIAAAVAVSHDLQGRFDVVPEDRIVSVLGYQIHVAVESDADRNDQPIWSVRTRPDRNRIAGQST